jgi:hypothetical protein
MKKIVISWIVALMLTLVPSCLFAAYFVEIYRDDEKAIFLDTTSIEDHGTYYKAWTKTTYGTREAKKKAGEHFKIGKEVNHSLDLWAYEKNNKRMGALALYFYDNDKNIIESFNYENYPISWTSVVPGSIGELMIEKVYLFAGK